MHKRIDVLYAVPNPDFIVPVEIDGQNHSVYVLKRPGVDTFLERLGPQFEVVIFTASLSKVSPLCEFEWLQFLFVSLVA